LVIFDFGLTRDPTEETTTMDQQLTIENPKSKIQNRIRPLSPSVVNKIAAGEVIERPASVVKELLENAVDAGATRIDVTVEGGGSELVRVVDDGWGIAADQLMLAVASHATSKIEHADDLFRVHTLGFRGEALASIAEVSRLEMRSRPANADGGARLEVVGGQPGEVVPCGSPPGTSIEVRDLFFNTPVRRKFLKSPQTELGHVSEAFTRVALAYPQLHFTLRHGDRLLYDLPAGERWTERIGRVVGQELAEGLIWVESRDGEIQLRGYVAHPSHSRANPRMQYLFLNGRAIRDRSLQHALGEAYRGLLLTGRFPIAFLSLSMPPEAVDVNVHPTKLEVRFQDGGRIYSQLLGTLRTKFLTTDLGTRLQPAALSTSPASLASGLAEGENGPATAHDPEHAGQVRQELVQWAQGRIAEWDASGAGGDWNRPDAAGGAGQADPGAAAALGRRTPLELTRLPQAWPAGTMDRERNRVADGGGPRPPIPPQPALSASRPIPALQVHNRYLVVESEEGIVVIDQHALHERILYEELRGRVLAGALESQALLVPEPVDLGPAEAAAALENRDVLAQLGIEVQPFGGETFLVSSYPAMLANMPPAEVFRGVIDKLLAGGKAPDRRDLLDSLLHMIACKAAIKAGDRLAPDEIAALLEQRHLVQDTHHCPHGRPTALTFTREELDKQFLRT
jgi:DNA mismatch repair protein MutL